MVVFPQGDPHVLSSVPRMRAEPVLDAYRRPAPGESLPFYLEVRGGGADSAHLICGFLGCDTKPFNPLIEALPQMVHVADGYSLGDDWLASLIRAAVDESRHKRVGSEGMLSRLSELIFIEVMRRYMESLPQPASGWFAALSDPHIGKALQLLHENPAYHWSLAELARRVAVSRTVLVERFTGLLGMPPMAYLVNWRMQIATGLLAGSSMTISQITENVDHESEAAFSRAFKRCNGLSPALWRKRHTPGRDDGSLHVQPGSDSATPKIGE